LSLLAPTEERDLAADHRRREQPLDSGTFPDLTPENWELRTEN
jgi:hypothetical protein